MGVIFKIEQVVFDVQWHYLTRMLEANYRYADESSGTDPWCIMLNLKRWVDVVEEKNMVSMPYSIADHIRDRL